MSYEATKWGWRPVCRGLLLVLGGGGLGGCAGKFGLSCFSAGPGPRVLLHGPRPPAGGLPSYKTMSESSKPRHVIQNHVREFKTTSRHTKPRHVIQNHVTSYKTMSEHSKQRHVIQNHIGAFKTTSRHTKPRHVIQNHVSAFKTTSRHTKPRPSI